MGNLMVHKGCSPIAQPKKKYTAIPNLTPSCFFYAVPPTPFLALHPNMAPQTPAVVQALSQATAAGARSQFSHSDPCASLPNKMVAAMAPLTSSTACTALPTRSNEAAAVPQTPQSSLDAPLRASCFCSQRPDAQAAALRHLQDPDLSITMEIVQAPTMLRYPVTVQRTIWPPFVVRDLGRSVHLDFA